MKTTKYTLRHKVKGTYVTYYTTANSGGYCCGSETFHIRAASSPNDDIWLLDSISEVYYALHNSTEWYNAEDKESPNHNLDPDEWEVVKYCQTVEVSLVGSSVYDSINDETISGFILQEYSKTKYHNSVGDVSSMVEDYLTGSATMCSWSMFPMYIEYLTKLQEGE